MAIREAVRMKIADACDAETGLVQAKDEAVE